MKVNYVLNKAFIVRMSEIYELTSSLECEGYVKPKNLLQTGQYDI